MGLGQAILILIGKYNSASSLSARRSLIQGTYLTTQPTGTPRMPKTPNDLLATRANRVTPSICQQKRAFVTRKWNGLPVPPLTCCRANSFANMRRKS